VGVECHTRPLARGEWLAGERAAACDQMFISLISRGEAGARCFGAMSTSMKMRSRGLVSRCLAYFIIYRKSFSLSSSTRGASFAVMIPAPVSMFEGARP
jgi:hypothetical protein